jgi:AraC-like DNA-binding protein
MDGANTIMYKVNMGTACGGPSRLVINSAARFHCAADWSWDTSRVGMPDRDLWIVLAGTGEMRAHTAEPGPTRTTRHYQLSRGDVFVIDEHVPVAARHDPADPLTVVAVHFDGGGQMRFHTRVTPVEFLAGIVERLLRCRVRGDDDAAVRWLQAALDEVRSAVHRNASGEADATGAVASLADEIRERPGDDWRVAVMAERLSLTPQHLGRLFRRGTGRSPKEYVLSARLETARAYLRGSSLPIKRIAADLGFHDEFHFSRLFRRKTGMSPSEYRR